MRTERIDTGWCLCGHRFQDHLGSRERCEFDGCDCQIFVRGSKPKGNTIVHTGYNCSCPRNPNGTVMSYQSDCKRHEYIPCDVTVSSVESQKHITNGLRTWLKEIKKFARKTILWREKTGHYELNCIDEWADAMGIQNNKDAKGIAHHVGLAILRLPYKGKIT